MKYIVIFIIGIYRFIKKTLISSGLSNPSCKFYPTCSEYMISAIKKYGVIIGVNKGIKRISRCTPNREHTVDNL